jgi:hypothetical protein
MPALLINNEDDFRVEVVVQLGFSIMKNEILLLGWGFVSV